MRIEKQAILKESNAIHFFAVNLIWKF